VTIGDDASIWPMAVARGDVNAITIGSGTNIQDGSVLHVTQPNETHPQGLSLNIGSRVTVGHGVILHACTIEDLVLVGMGATVMDGAVVRARTMIGAGSLVPPGKVLESGFLYLGTPARQIRKLTEAELAWLETSAQHYIELKNRYLAATPR
jgi:carbonic anhydrase/acetyltransferase-like protein (isoleucine patch superfamily)